MEVYALILVGVAVVFAGWVVYQLRRWLLWLAISALVGVAVPGLVVSVLLIVARVQSWR